MKKLSTNEIRQLWFDFFKNKQHLHIPSAPLIPQNDPTLLWINSGVAALKKYFDGREIPKNRRLVNSQKSLRTNDINNVGRTARHHTFFEMLGNFSIGDYFRDEALEWGLEFLISPDYLGLPLEKLYFTVYPTDQESVDKWLSLGISPEHIIEVADNFWEIGEGPCGPNTEIFFDRGPEYDPNLLGTQLIAEDLPNDRYIEIWNIVFSQYNAVSGLSRDEYPELPSKNIDTGMGLERVACVLQGAETNFDTDLFLPIINKITELTNVEYSGQMAFKVISDHIRCIVFAISDGASISNEGRGYVLRRILRRAIRYGKNLGMNEPFLYKLVDEVVLIMEEAYPELKKNATHITKLIHSEEEKFLETLENGEKRLIEYLETNDSKVVDGAMTFLLYDTFGFPLELTIEVASEHGYRVDEKGFYAHLQRQKETSRQARSELDSLMSQNKAMLDFTQPDEFIGYTTLQANAKIIAIFKNGELVDQAQGEVVLVCDKVPFYAESGGQVGDRGILELNNKQFTVSDTIKLPNNQHGLIVDLGQTTINVGSEVVLSVDEKRRKGIIKNHSATHLLHQALKDVLGSHVQQQGSSLNERTLRFDFNNYTNVSESEILKIEEIVNREIKKAHRVTISFMELEEAKKAGVQALFDYKYGEKVRVVSMDYAKELCGGTHVNNTKEIEQFAILNIESVGSGTYRITASTSNNILNELQSYLSSIHTEINHLNTRGMNLVNEAIDFDIKLEFTETKLPQLVASYQSIIDARQVLDNLREEIKELDKTLTKLKRENIRIDRDDFKKELIKIKDKHILITQVENLENDIAKDLIDRLSDGFADIVLLANLVNNRIVFLMKSNTKAVPAGTIIREIAKFTGGNGGGRAEFAQAGGRDIAKVPEALKLAKTLIEESL